MNTSMIFRTSVGRNLLVALVSIALVAALFLFGRVLGHALAQTDATSQSQTEAATNGKILFFSGFGSTAKIYKVDPSQPASDVLLGQGMFPSWKPNGSAILFADPTSQAPGDSNSAEIKLMDPDGSNRRSLPTAAFASQVGGGPAWSPDGTMIVFPKTCTDCSSQFDTNLWVMNADGSSQTKFTNVKNAGNQVNRDGNPAWQTVIVNGQVRNGKIAFVRDFFINGRNYDEILTINFSSITASPCLDDLNCHPTNLSNNPHNNSSPWAGDFNPSWSPDGAKIVFSSNRDSTSSPFEDIYVMNPQGTILQRVTNDNYLDVTPVFSPDGTQIAWGSGYRAGTTGDPYIFVMPSTGNPIAASSQQKISLNIGDSPSWGPGPAVCVNAPSGLQAWYQGEGNANDAGGTNNGTLQGAVTFSAGEVGQAFNFNGANTGVQIPDSPSNKPANITVDTWVKFNSLDSTTSSPGLQYLVFKKNTRTAGFEGYTLIKDRTNGVDKLGFIITSANGPQASIRSTTAVSTGIWYHVAGTYDGATATLYVNGVAEASANVSFPLDYSTRPLFLGTSGESFDGKLNGSLDEVHIFNRALSAAEIQSLYNAASAGICYATPTPTPTPTPVPVTLTFDGKLRDRVNRSDAGLSGDGDPDGTFTLTVPGQYANKFLSKIVMTGPNGDSWDTIPGNGIWVVGLAASLDGTLFNDSNGSVPGNFQVGNNALFKLFVPAAIPDVFVQGSVINITLTFSDNTTATASTTINKTPFVDLGIALTGPPDGSPTATDTMHYNARITNYGTTTATNVQFLDQIPDANCESSGTLVCNRVLSVEPADLCDQTIVGQLSPLVRCNLGTLLSQQSIAVRISFRALDPQKITNTASVTSSQIENTPDSHANSATVSTLFATPTDLSVTMTGPSDALTTDDLSYTIHVQNNSLDQDAHGVTMTDVVPANSTFVSVSATSASVTCGQSGGTVSCNFPTLEKHAAFQNPIVYDVTLKVHPQNDDVQTIVNTADISSNASVDNNLLNNEAAAATNLSVGTDISVSMNAPAQVTNGASFTYDILVRNNGPRPAAHVLISDELPSNVNFVSVSPGAAGPGPKCFQADATDPNAINCDLGAMQNGDSLSAHITVQPTQSGNIANTAAAFNADNRTTDPHPADNQAQANTIACVPANSVVPVFQTAGSPYAPVGLEYKYKVRATSATGAHVAYSLTQGPSGMTITSLDDGSALLHGWTPDSSSLNQTVPVSVLASDGTCNGMAPQNFSVTVSDPPPPGGFYIQLGQVKIYSDAIKQINGSSSSTKASKMSPSDFPSGTYQLGGHTQINNYLAFDGSVTVVLDRTNATLSVAVSQGSLSLTNIPLYGNYTIWQGGGLNFTVDGNGEVTKFLQTNVQKPLQVAGVDVIIDHATLILNGDFGIKIQGHLKFPNVANVQGLNASFSDLFITQQHGIRFNGTISVPNFNIAGFGIQDVKMQWIANDDPTQDVFEGGGKLVTPAFQVIGDVKFIGGGLDSVTAGVNTSLIGFPLPPPAPIFNVTGGTVKVQNIQTGPFTIALSVNLTLVNPALSNVLELHSAGLTYTAPATLIGTSDLKVLTANVAKVALGFDIPHSVSLGGSVTLIDSFQLLKLSADMKVGILFIEGSASAVLQIPDGDDPLRSWLKSNPIHSVTLPYPIAGAKAQWNLNANTGQMNFAAQTQLASIDLNAIISELAGDVSARVGANWGPLNLSTQFGAAQPVAKLNPDAAGLSSRPGSVSIASMPGRGPMSLASLTVAAGTPQIMFDLYAAGGATRYDLIKPDGTRITPDNAGANGAAFAVAASTSEGLFLVTNPAAGTWNIEAEDTTQGPFILQALGADSPPVINSILATQSASSVQINYNATDADDNAPVSLYYDRNSAGFHGSLIASGLPESSSGTYVWNAGDGSVASGDYYVYAVIDDGKNQPVMQYAPAKVTIVDPFSPATPQGVTVKGGVGNNLIVSWNPNSETNIRGYQIFYGFDRGAATVLDQTFDAGNLTSIVLPGLLSATAYKVSVAAYTQTTAPDPANPQQTNTLTHLSITSTPQTGTSGIAVPPVVHVTSPNGAEQLAGNGDINVSWTIDQAHDVINQRIELSTDGGTTYRTLTQYLDGSVRNFIWHVPASSQSTKARIRVTATDKSGNVSSDTSDANFTITAGPAPAVFQFSTSSYTVSEGAGSASVTVNRTGDANSFASVHFATSGGSAKEGRDYTAAFGVLNFAPGESSKNVTVLIIDNSYVDGSRTVNLALSNPAGAALAAQSTAVLTINDNDSSPSASNPIDQARFFVQQHYYDFLGRYPDQSGWDFWTNEIASCGADQTCIGLKRINVSAAYFLSIEFQQTGYLVERIYKTAYGSGSGTSTFGGPHQFAVPVVRFNEFLPDTQQIGSGVVVGANGWETVLENNKQAFTSDFVQRSRFTSAFANTLTPAQFVDALFANAGVTPTAGDRQTVLNEFGTAATSADVSARARALRDVAENATLNTQEFNRAFVLMQYFGYLRRDPNGGQDADYTGFDFWLTKLNQFNGNFVNAEMVKAFITSTEYRQRFGP
jgi:uncharacterized repeat protein (TIGR01451 family)